MEELPGINVQQPWAQLLLSGEKTIETRTYPLPDHYIDQDMWLIETPGRSGKFKARVIGKIRFSGSKEYSTADQFYQDYERHHIDEDNLDYKWDGSKRKFGWIVDNVESVDHFIPPQSRGIVYARPFSMESFQ